MHWNIEQILWAFILAGHLILLVVLLGRDRISRFPWFSASIALSTVHLIADHLLHGKFTTMAFYWESYATVLIESILGIFVLIELLRRVFSSGRAGICLNAKGWLGWTLVTVSIALAAVWFWGPWPTWQALNADPKQTPLLATVLASIKLEQAVAILTVEAALLLRIFGRRFGYGWKTHVQQIALGLSTNALAFITVQITTDTIKRTVKITSRDQYEHIVRLFTNIDNARFAIWLLVLIWWIFWLWRDDPTEPASATEPVEAPVLAGPPSQKADIPGDSEPGAPE